MPSIWLWGGFGVALGGFASSAATRCWRLDVQKQRFLGLRCVFAAATAKPPGSRVSFPGPAVWCRQTRRNARLQRWVLRSFRWNAKAPSAPAPLLADFGDALGRPKVVLPIASGWLQGAYRLATRWLRGGFGMAPLPCRFPPPGFIDNRPLAISSPVGLHCLSAFALPAREDVRADRGLSGGGLHCLSAFCPPGSALVVHTPAWVLRGLHCLSAFCPPGSAVMVSVRVKAPPGLPCLSAFCPPGSALRPRQADIQRSLVSIAFRRSVPPARAVDVGGILCRPVSIAFRRSVPPTPDHQPAVVGMSDARLHCLSAFCPPRLSAPRRYAGDCARWVSIAFRRSVPPAPAGTVSALASAPSSPLPFGVLPPGFKEVEQWHYRFVPMSPLPFGVLPPGFHS